MATILTIDLDNIESIKIGLSVLDNWVDHTQDQQPIIQQSNQMQQRVPQQVPQPIQQPVQQVMPQQTNTVDNVKVIRAEEDNF